MLERGIIITVCSVFFLAAAVDMNGGQALSTATPPHSRGSSAAPSFYKRPLPSACTAFSSPLGRRVFQSAMHTGGLKSFFALIEQHTTQTEPAYCGLATLVVALNAMALDPRHNWKGPWRWYHEELLQCCSDFNLEAVKKQGITMAGFRCLAICQGLGVDVKYADEDSTTLDSFREAIRRACVDEPDNLGTAVKHSGQPDASGEAVSHVLVVSYDRKTMGQTGSGHFAPVAAYDSDSDSVLILDTARFKYGCHWVAVSQLFEALKPIDSASDRSRGYIVLTKSRQRSLSADGDKPRVLLRVMEGSTAETVIQEFLSFWREKGADLQWEDFLSFWTKKNTDPGYIWYVCDPVVKPCQEDEIGTVENALAQLRYKMLQDIGRSAPESDSCWGHCRPNRSRSVPLLHIEAIYLVFLAARAQNGCPDPDFSDAPDGELLRASVASLRKALFN